MAPIAASVLLLLLAALGEAHPDTTTSSSWKQMAPEKVRPEPVSPLVVLPDAAAAVGHATPSIPLQPVVPLPPVPKPQPQAAPGYAAASDAAAPTVAAPTSGSADNNTARANATAEAAPRIEPGAVALDTMIKGPPAAVAVAEAGAAATVASYDGRDPTKHILVAVCTAPTHRAHRTAIRHTWGALANRRSSVLGSSMRGAQVDVRFFIGKLPAGGHDGLEAQLDEEARLHGDIVRVDSFVESYDNLTLKTLAMVRYANRNSPAGGTYDLMMKVDDDTFVLLDTAIAEIFLPDYDLATLWWGKFWGDDRDPRPVDRNPQSKYYLSRDQYAPEYFPNYPDGPCYAVGSEIIAWLDRHANRLVPYRLEDSAMGVWINDAYNLNFRSQHVEGFMYARTCPYGMWYSFINPVAPDEMYTIYKAYTSSADICDGGYSLAVCDDPVKGCLCSPSLPGQAGCWDKQWVVDA